MHLMPPNPCLLQVHLEKLGHTAGPVLRPPDHVDKRSERGMADGTGGQEKRSQVSVIQEGGTQEIGVNCAEIIHNITLGGEELEF